MGDQFEHKNKTFISTNLAAELTGYSQDYIGQLARDGHVASTKTGRQRFIDRDELVAYARANKSGFRLNHLPQEHRPDVAGAESQADETVDQPVVSGESTVEKEGVKANQPASSFSEETEVAIKAGGDRSAARWRKTRDGLRANKLPAVADSMSRLPAVAMAFVLMTVIGIFGLQLAGSNLDDADNYQAAAVAETAPHQAGQPGLLTTAVDEAQYSANVAAAAVSSFGELLLRPLKNFFVDTLYFGIAGLLELGDVLVADSELYTAPSIVYDHDDTTEDQVPPSPGSAGSLTYITTTSGSDVSFTGGASLIQAVTRLASMVSILANRIDSEPSSGISAAVRDYVNDQIDDVEDLARANVDANLYDHPSTIILDGIEVAGIDVTGSADINRLNVAATTSIDGATFFVDATNNRVGIGTSTPQYKLDVDGDLRVTGFIVNGTSSLATTTITDLFVPGNTTLGDSAATDTVTFNSRFLSDLTPATTGIYSLGSSTLRFANGFFTDQVLIGGLTVGTSSITSASGQISFGDENLVTSGTLSAATTTLATTSITSLTASSTNTDTFVANNATTTNSYIQNLLADNSTTTNAYIANLIGDDATLTNLEGTNATITNATTTNFFASLANFTQAFFDQLTASIATIANLTVTNSTTTNATTTNSYITNLSVDDAQVTDLVGENATITNATTTNFFSSMATLTQAIISNLTATVASITNLTAENATTTDLVTTNLTATGTTDLATTTADNITVAGTATTTNLVVLDDATFGDTVVDSFVVNSTIGSDLVPNSNQTYNLGSPAFYWDAGYIDTLNVNNISAASSSISGTVAESFTINSDNSTFDDEAMSLVFYRGQVTPNAVIEWDNLLDRFSFNQPGFFWNEASSTTIPTLITQGSVGQTADLFQAASSSGDVLVSITADGTIVAPVASTTELIATDALITNSSTTNAYITSLSGDDADITNINTENATATNAYIQSLIVDSGEVTDLVGTNATITNATTTNFFASLANLTTAIISNLTASVATITDLTAANSTTTNATTTNSYIANLSADSGSIAELTGENATITNATTTNFFASLANFTTAFFDTLTATVANITNLDAQNATTTNLVATDASTENLTASGTTGLATTTITNLSASTTDTDTLTATDGTITDLIVTNSTTTNAYIANLSGDTVDFENIDVENATATNLVATNALIENSTTTNATTTNSYITNLTADSGSIAELTGENATITNATTTNFFAQLATFTSAFFDTLTATVANITNLDAQNATTTNLVATNATSTNLFAAAASFTTSIIDNLTATFADFVNLEADNATTTDLVTTQLTATGTINLATSTITAVTTGGDTINDFTGQGLSVANNVLNIDDIETLGTSLAAGSVVFSDGSTLTEDNANFFWDDANNRLGIGTDSPGYKLHVVDSEISDNIQAAFISGAGSTGKRNEIQVGRFAESTQNSAVFGHQFVDGGGGDFAYLGTVGFENSLVTQAGNVGIGTTSPNSRFHIFEGDAGSYTTISGTSATIESDTTNYLSMISPDNSISGTVYGTPGDTFAGLTRWNPASDALEIASANGGASIDFYTGNFDFAATIDSSGNVGIGTTTPEYPLEVAGVVAVDTASDYKLRLQDPENTDWNFVTAGNFFIRENDSDYRFMIQDGTGNVGIGTTNPATTLDVAGTTTAQAFTVGGDTINDFTGNQLAVTGNTLGVVDGAGSGLDADTLDTFDSSQFLRSDTSDSFTSGTLTFDPGTTLNVEGDANFSSNVSILSNGQLVVTADSFGTSIDQGPVYINPSTAGVNNVLLGLAVGGSERVRFDAEGDIQITGLFNSTETSGTNELAGSLNVDGDVALGDSASSTVTFNALVSGDIIPTTDNTYNLGSSDLRFANVYAATTTIDNLVTGGTASSTFTINTQNTSADAEDATLAFERGSETPNATLKWNAAAGQFEFNSFPVSFADNINVEGTASSTFAGPLWLTGSSGGTAGSDSVLYINPSSGSTDNSLFSVAVSDAERFSIDAEGDVLAHASLGIENALFDISNTTLTIDDDLQINGNDIKDSTGTTRLTLGSINTITGDLSVTGDSAAASFSVGGDTINDFTGQGLSVAANVLNIDDIETLGTSLAAGSVVFSDGSTLTEDNANFFWDDVNNRLGIGTDSPTQLLDVSGENATASINSSPLLRLTRPSTGGVKYTNAAEFNLGSYGTALSSQSRLDLTMVNGGTHDPDTTVMTWLANGNVGIGTTSPEERLHVEGNLKLTDNTLSPDSVTFDSETSTGLRLTNQNGYISLTPLNSGTAHIYTDRNFFHFNRPIYSIANKFSAYSTGNLELQTAGTTRIIAMQATGNVGIGTTSPATTLDVAGTTTAQAFAVGGDTINDFTGQGLSVSANILNIDNIETLGTSLAAGSVVFSDGSNLAEDNTNFFWDDANNRLGIGTTSPSAQLTVTGDIFGNIDGVSTNDFIFGSATTSDTGNTANDSRFFFDTSKSAFRAGEVLGDQWDDVNVGDHSVAFGNDTTASGQYSAAFGSGTTASGNYSAAFGSDSTASDDYTTAFGLSTTANGLAATAFGRLTEADNLYATAFGFFTTASGEASIAFGDSTTASGNNSVAFGEDIEALGDYSFAVALDGLQTGVQVPANTAAFMGGNVGIGTTTPLATLTVAGDIIGNPDGVSTDDFIFGSTQTGDTGNSANDSRFFFDTSKSAFRAGEALGDQWDDVNVGQYSVAFGRNSEASDNYAVAIGDNNTASGNSAAAFGGATTASGNYASAFGFNTTASNAYATAFGHQTTADGMYSASFGVNTEASGDASTAFGQSIEAFGDYSFAVALDANQTGVQVAANTAAFMGGNVGIGTASPKLDLQLKEVGGFYQTGLAGARNFNFAHNSYFDGSDFRRLQPDNETTLIQFLESGGLGLFTESDSNNTVDSVITYASRFRILGNGNVGIGTANPSSLLQLGQDSGGNSNYLTIGKGFDTHSGIKWSRGGNNDSQIYVDAAEDLIFETDVDGLTPNNDFIFQNNGTELARLTDGGQLGIGSASPSAVLDVLYESAGDRHFTLETNGPRLQRADGGGTANHYGFLGSGGTDHGGFGAFVNGDTLNYYFIGEQYTDGDLVVDPSGNVGIGNTGPSETLDVTGSIAASSYLTIGGEGRTSTYLSGSASLAVDGWTYTTGILNSGETGGAPAGVVFGNGSTLGTDQVSLVTNGSTRLYVSSAGNVGIGNSSANQALDVTGTIRQSAVTSCADVETNASGDFICGTSDKNLKKNIRAIDSATALEQVRALRGVTYDWKDEEQFGHVAGLGFIAQEVELIFPDLVRYTGEYKSLDYDKLTAVLAEAVEELDDKVEGISLSERTLSPEGSGVNEDDIVDRVVDRLAGFIGSTGEKITGFFDTLFAKEIVVAREEGEANQAAGEAEIAAGEDRAEIANALVDEDARVLVTFTSSLSGRSFHVEKEDGSFAVILSEALAADGEPAAFDYLIVGVADVDAVEQVAGDQDEGDEEENSGAMGLDSLEPRGEIEDPEADSGESDNGAGDTSATTESESGEDTSGDNGETTASSTDESTVDDETASSTDAESTSDEDSDSTSSSDSSEGEADTTASSTDESTNDDEGGDSETAADESTDSSDETDEEAADTNETTDGEEVSTASTTDNS